MTQYHYKYDLAKDDFVNADKGKMDENSTNKIRTVRDLKVYRKAFDSAMECFAKNSQKGYC